MNKVILLVLKYCKNYYFILLYLLFAGCQVNKLSKSEKQYILEIQHMFDNEPLVLNKKYVINSGDTIAITKFQYYLSNISFNSRSGQLWKETNSYRLFRLEDNHIWEVPVNIPFDYLGNISFSIGVDSLQNSQGQQNGDLDPLNGMFWTWKTGYIFFKIEGYTWNSSGERFPLIIHVGSNSCFRTTSYQVEGTNFLQITLDMKSILNLETHLKFGQRIQTMTGKKSTIIADNFIKAFSQK